MILRTTYDGTGGGVAEDRRFYYCQNWRADVSVVLDDAGVQQERVIYSPYGQPFAMPAGDTNFDGDFEAGVDGDELADWDINGVPYRAYADVNLDGNVNGADATASTEHDLGWNVLTSDDVKNRIGQVGSVCDRDIVQSKILRGSTFSSVLGRALQRYGSSLDGDPPCTTYDPCGGCTVGDLSLPGCGKPGDPKKRKDPEPDPPTGTITTDDKCGQNLLKSCVGDPEFDRAIAYWRQTCGPKQRVTILCRGKQCGTPGLRGYYCCGSRRIHLCPGGQNCRTLAHELIHAADHCDGTICRILPLPGQCGGFDCNPGACSEVRAHAYAGSCCPAASQQGFQQCLEDYIRDNYPQYKWCCGDPIGKAAKDCTPPFQDACGTGPVEPWPRMMDSTGEPGCGAVVPDSAGGSCS